MTNFNKDSLMTKIAKKRTAFDKAMELAAIAGKPTSTGLATGAGLGAVLATLGAASRSGSPDEDNSIISNPLLLGALGAGTGYLAGNALEKAPAKNPESSSVAGALAGLPLAGLGVHSIGQSIAKSDSERELARSLDNRATIHTRIRENIEKSRFRNGSPREMTILEKERLNRADRDYIRKLIRSGRAEEADQLISELNIPSRTKARKILDSILHDRRSPLRSIQALNILPIGLGGKRLDIGARELNKFNRSGGVFGQIKDILMRNGSGKGSNAITRSLSKAITVPRLGALAALAGAGKFTYDRVKKD